MKKGSAQINWIKMVEGSYTFLPMTINFNPPPLAVFSSWAYTRSPSHCNGKEHFPILTRQQTTMVCERYNELQTDILSHHYRLLSSFLVGSSELTQKFLRLWRVSIFFCFQFWSSNDTCFDYLGTRIVRGDNNDIISVTPITFLCFFTEQRDKQVLQLCFVLLI